MLRKQRKPQYVSRLSSERTAAALVSLALHASHTFRGDTVQEAKTSALVPKQPEL